VSDYQWALDEVEALAGGVAGGVVVGVAREHCLATRASSSRSSCSMSSSGLVVFL